jgi:rare lipoprotein A
MNFALGRYLAIGMLLGMISACARQAHDPSRTLPSVPPAPDSRELEGMASWYGQTHHGHRLASGEIYNMHRLTAAHRTLPFHTVVQVHNKRNGREVDVRINDRGPFVKGRVIDLSYAAAKALDMLKPGTAPVRLKIVRLHAQSPEQEFAVGAGVLVRSYDDETIFSRVWLGHNPPLDAAQELAAPRRQEHFEPMVVSMQ